VTASAPIVVEWVDTAATLAAIAIRLWAMTHPARHELLERELRTHLDYLVISPRLGRVWSPGKRQLLLPRTKFSLLYADRSETERPHVLILELRAPRRRPRPPSYPPS
jgi:plasmid stabilization system protein ParE